MASSSDPFNNYIPHPLRDQQDPPDGIPDRSAPFTARSNSFHALSSSPTSRSRHSSPSHSPRLGPSRLSSSSKSHSQGSPSSLKSRLSSCLWNWNPQQRMTKTKVGLGRVWYRRKRVKLLLVLVGLLGSLVFVNWIMILRLQNDRVDSNGRSSRNSAKASVSISLQERWRESGKGKKPLKGTYDRLLALAAHALAEVFGLAASLEQLQIITSYFIKPSNWFCCSYLASKDPVFWGKFTVVLTFGSQGQNKREPKDLWQEPFVPASSWRPCADQRNWEPSVGNNGYILVTANGGMNQQRVAVCNAVVVARLLNSTLVIPKFMYSSVWRDISQFSDIYQEEHFINYLTPDIRIVKELPRELQSLNLEAIGSVVTDVDITKEAKPRFYLKNILPILLKNRVVHFVGFGNRLAFDPIPFELQRVRCRCNFHALQFVPRIQETGALLLRRLHQNTGHTGPLDHYLLGPYAESKMKPKSGQVKKPSKYLALHLRFEIDMVAHSSCEFGGGEAERQELESYREIHFPALTLLKKTIKLPSPSELRSEGLCPLSPEEAILMLAALGFNRMTHIFVAGSQLYGGPQRLTALTSLYPKLVTKENLLSSTELEPFANYSSRLAALDYIGCTAADAFAMTDSGSQLSSLVSGYRIYYGGGRMPTIRPNKRRLASIFMKNNTIEWRVFEQRVRKAVRQTKHVQTRPKARSVYRYPRCKECMCKTD